MKKIFTTLFLATSMLTVAHAGHAQSQAAKLKPILDAEKAWAKLSTDSSVQRGFDRYLTADALVFRPRTVRAIEYRKRSPMPASLVLTWAPEYADISRAGDLAFTTGEWASIIRGTGADPKFGFYVTAWRKQADGKWLATFNGSVRMPGPEQVPPKLFIPSAPSGYVSKASREVERNSLLTADNSFAAAAKQQGYVAALRPDAHKDIRTLRNGVEAMFGIDSIASAHKNARVTMWMPVEATIAASADLGYTRGSYVVSLPNGANEGGDYIRMWRREANGKWRIVLDMLSPDVRR